LGAAASPAPEANANTSSQTIDVLTQFLPTGPALVRRAACFLTYELCFSHILRMKLTKQRKLERFPLTEIPAMR
jgi:hypothetical protein